MRMLAIVSFPVLAFLLPACAGSSGSVVDKVLQDFGIRDRPEGYVSGADEVTARLPAVGEREMKRLNIASRRGEVKFEERGDLRGKFYKEVRRYERYYPIDAKPSGRGRGGTRGYVGRIEFSYRVYQSARKSTRAEAATLSAEISTSERGIETFQYQFNSSGVWNGVEGVPAGRY